MRVELTEVLWLDEHYELSLRELAELTGLPEAEILELVDCGAITPLAPEAPAWTFGADCVTAARTAARLRRDFDLDSQGLALALTLIEHVNALEARLRQLDAQLPHRTG
ncbi:MAG: chaperone modulator CbpM [Gammaproteobacteria bacterium]